MSLSSSPKTGNRHNLSPEQKRINRGVLLAVLSVLGIGGAVKFDQHVNPKFDNELPSTSQTFDPVSTSIAQCVNEEAKLLCTGEANERALEVHCTLLHEDVARAIETRRREFEKLEAIEELRGSDLPEVAEGIERAKERMWSESAASGEGGRLTKEDTAWNLLRDMANVSGTGFQFECTYPREEASRARYRAWFAKQHTHAPAVAGWQRYQ